MRIHVDAIQSIAKAHHLEEPTQDAETFMRFLEWWWCRTFNRPMKDPLLKSYTPDELLYEFLRHFYMNPEHDPRKEIEAKHTHADEEEWIRKMLAQGDKVTPEKPKSKPTKKKAPIKKAKRKAKHRDLPEVSTRFED
jgi:hypothetical protein